MSHPETLQVRFYPELRGQLEQRGYIFTTMPRSVSVSGLEQTGMFSYKLQDASGKENHKWSHLVKVNQRNMFQIAWKPQLSDGSDTDFLPMGVKVFYPSAAQLIYLLYAHYWGEYKAERIDSVPFGDFGKTTTIYTDDNGITENLFVGLETDWGDFLVCGTLTADHCKGVFPMVVPETLLF